MNMNHIYDVVGIGFGPSNLALAALFDENRDSRLSAIFLEQKSSFSWHENMLIPGAEMQISFLKDIATFRNPSSPFTFLNYLHSVGRLSLFANLGTFYPSRIEFNQYLTWVAEKLTQYVNYNCRVMDIHVYGKSPHIFLKVIYEKTDDKGRASTSYLLTRNIVVAAGGAPNIPPTITRQVDNERIWHTSQYLQKIEKYKSQAEHPYHFGVIGGGQSAAEVMHDLYQAFPNATINCVHSNFALKAADDSEFINEIFLPENIDLFYDASHSIRKTLLESHQDTNYAVVDTELIQKLYRIKYEELVTKKKRLYFHRLFTMESAHETYNHVEVNINNCVTTSIESLQVDALILATGYTYFNPPPVLRSLSNYIITDKLGLPKVTRHHQLLTLSNVKAGIYLQGYHESTHGLTDTLLSANSVRAQGIFDQILSGSRQHIKYFKIKHSNRLVRSL
jgi:L-ornithine N5-oxygenase